MSKQCQDKICRYYPHCRYGDKCRFLHRDKICRYFPHCPYQNSCRYLHSTQLVKTLTTENLFDRVPDEMLQEITSWLPTVTNEYFRSTCARMRKAIKTRRQNASFIHIITGCFVFMHDDLPEIRSGAQQLAQLTKYGRIKVRRYLRRPRVSTIQLDLIERFFPSGSPFLPYVDPRSSTMTIWLNGLKIFTFDPAGRIGDTEIYCVADKTQRQCLIYRQSLPDGIKVSVQSCLTRKIIYSYHGTPSNVEQEWLIKQ